VSPEQRTGQKQIAKTVIIERKGKKEEEEALQEKKQCVLPGDTEALIFLFKDQFISCKAGKIWAVCRKGLGWLAGLISTALPHNMGILCFDYSNF
jgi:hypothetical protein